MPDDRPMMALWFQCFVCHARRIWGTMGMAWYAAEPNPEKLIAWLECDNCQANTKHEFHHASHAEFKDWTPQRISLSA